MDDATTASPLVGAVPPLESLPVPAPATRTPRRHRPRQPVAAVMPEPEDYLALGERYPSPETRALFFTAYLAAARISECLSLRKRNLVLKPANERLGTPEHFAFTQIPVLKRRENAEKIVLWRAAPVWVWDKPALRCGVPHGPTYRRMLDHVRNWANHLAEDAPLFRWRPDHPEKYGFEGDELTGPGRAAAFAALSIVTIDGRPFNPHHNRHARITHLITHEGYTLSQAREFVKHSKIESLNPYSHLEYDDLLPR